MYSPDAEAGGVHGAAVEADGLDASPDRPEDDGREAGG